MQFRPLAHLALFAFLVNIACGIDVNETATSSAAATESTEGVVQNGLSSNGLFQNGLFQNGLFQNGLFENSLGQVSLFQNGSLQSTLWQDEFWQANPTALAVLRGNEYAGAVLQYIYECAIPKSTVNEDGSTVEEKVVLDPGKTKEEGGIHRNLKLEGGSGLAPQWAKPGGTCNESCQRWVSACVLARTNAYGVKVDLSMRAPANAPDDIRNALAPNKTNELTEYGMLEGAFYGNLFHQAPGPDGLMKMAPSLHACAGPGSNIPQVTKRFCSSQGNGGPIQVAGMCGPPSDVTQGACLSKDDETGAMGNCSTRTDPDDRGDHYDEVITVYLKRPIVVCGNSVCEANEEKDKDEAKCPSDCHPGSWARSFPTTLADTILEAEPNPTLDKDSSFSAQNWARSSAVDPDGNVVLAGVAPSTVDVGGGPLDTGPNGNLYGVLAKYKPDGEHLWSKRFGGDFTSPVKFQSVAISPVDRQISVLLNDSGRLRLGAFTPDGEPRWSAAWVPTDETATIEAQALAADQYGSLIVSGTAHGESTFDALMVGGDESKPGFVLKLSSQDGSAIWSTRLAVGSTSGAKGIATDDDGNVLLAFGSAGGGGLWKLDAWSGETENTWPKPGGYLGVAADADGNVYATGVRPLDKSATVYPFEFPATSYPGDVFLVKFSAAGDPPIVQSAGVGCSPLDEACAGQLEGRDIAVDAAGNVIIGVFGGSTNPIDFGRGPFRTYATPDVFIAAFSPELEPLWSKHVPMVLNGIERGLHLDGRGWVVLSGVFAGSMLVDDHLLVSPVPEDPSVGNTFLAAFKMPSDDDGLPPEVDLNTVPKSMTLEATSGEGAPVFFLPPTAIDAGNVAGNAGVSVTCSPPPNTVFLIGTTTVECTARDPFGNSKSGEGMSFNVTVLDTLGPVFAPTLEPILGVAEAPAGAVVFFDPPLAVDLVDGKMPVECKPASGTLFPLGMTTVICNATDGAGHQTETAIGVIVMDLIRPAITNVPAPPQVEAIGPAGAPVNYEVPLAFDQVDGSLPVVCEPASGAVLPLGTTTVYCLTIDAAGNYAEVTFDATVVDTTAPTLVTPAHITAVTDSWEGAIVTYETSATDAVDGPLEPYCPWPSGWLFPPGETEVYCWVGDAHGNFAVRFFLVDVFVMMVEGPPWLDGDVASHYDESLGR